MSLPIDYLRGVAYALKRGRVVGDWEILGQGHFSRVFGSASFPDIVLKLSGAGGYGGENGTWNEAGNDDYGRLEDAWPVFAKFCMRHDNTVWLPTVYHVERMTDSIHWGIIERLSSGSAVAHMHLRKMAEDIDAGVTDVHREFNALVMDNDFTTDIRTDNIMYRKWAGQIQPVLTDPIFINPSKSAYYHDSKCWP